MYTELLIKLRETNPSATEHHIADFIKKATAAVSSQIEYSRLYDVLNGDAPAESRREAEATWSTLEKLGGYVLRTRRAVIEKVQEMNALFKNAGFLMPLMDIDPAVNISIEDQLLDRTLVETRCSARQELVDELSEYILGTSEGIVSRRAFWLERENVNRFLKNKRTASKKYSEWGG